MVCIFKYKCLNTSLLSLFEGWFKSSSIIHKHKTRLNYNIESELSTNNLFIPIARTSEVNGPKIWNTIPNDIRFSLPFTRFKELSKNHLIYNYNL